MTFVRVCTAGDIPKGAVVAVRVGDTPIALAHCEDGTYHAVIDVCSHEDYPLSDGTVAGCAIECMWHGSEFDLRTGEALNLPATQPIAVYPVEVRDGEVYVSTVPATTEAKEGKAQ